MAYLHTEAQMDALRQFVRGTQLTCKHENTIMVDIPDSEDEAGRLIDGGRFLMCNDHNCGAVVKELNV